MYVTLEAQVLRGISSDIDFSTEALNLPGSQLIFNR